MKQEALAVAIFFALAATTSMAQPPEDGPVPPPPPQGKERPNIHQLFDKADTDKDGSVSYADLKAVAPKMPQERFSTWDKNSDGNLTRNELPKPGGGDGRGRGPRPEGGGGPDGPGGPGEMRGPGGPGGQGRGDMLRRSDTNKDKKVTLDEFKAFLALEAENQFKRMDTDGDGVITQTDKPQRGPGRGPGGPEGGPGHDGPPPPPPGDAPQP